MKQSGLDAKAVKRMPADTDTLVCTSLDSLGVPQGSMMRDTSPWTCLRAGQSSVANTRVAPALFGTKYSVQVKDELLGTRLKPARRRFRF